MCGLLSNRFKTAFITGASSGLGLAMAEMLLAEGIHVWGTSREKKNSDFLKEKYPAHFTAVVLDLANPKDALSAYQAAEKEAGGTFDLVIQNAGYGIFAPFDAVSQAVWNDQISAMLGTTVQLSHAAFSTMRSRKAGVLVHVSSLATEFPLPFMSGYNIVKAGLSALSESLMFEAQGSGVVVIDFRPGDYRTAFNRGMKRSEAEVSRDPVLEKQVRRAWESLERNLNQSPLPMKAALDLKKALSHPRSGIVRSGSFFQAVLAPFFACFIPKGVLRRVTNLYFQ